MSPISNPNKTILISVDLSELRVAVLEEGRTVEAYIERRGAGSLVGNIYKGRVDNVLPGMEAAFVDIGLEKNGFLYVDEVVLPDVTEKERRRKRIQELLKPGQEVLVQVVKDPMGTKGARVTMELSAAGRFLVLAPDGEGKGVSRRLPDGERDRLRDAVKKLDAGDAGVIVRTAAEGASQEDLERDLRFLRKVWAQVEARAKGAPAPSLVHAEADLSLRVIRDLLTRNVDHVWVDNERQHRRIAGYVRATQPDLVDRVGLHTGVESLFEKHGVEAAIRSTLNRRVDLPSGGYLIFDYAEAFTVIDVNTGRFVGKSRLEDTITRNNMEAAREVVRQLRLRDIGGIIVIDFIDMSSAKNRSEVLGVLQSELEKDRTKTYVVEISPLGLVEMTRQNVTDGVREILTATCPTCGGEGVVLSENTMAVEAERRLRRIARATDDEAFLVKLNDKVASQLAGPGGMKLVELERATGKHFSFQGDEMLPLEEVDVLASGPQAEIERSGARPVEEGQELDLTIAEPHMYNVSDGLARLDGYVVVVAGAIGYVGQKHRVRIDRATATTAYATLLDAEPTPIDLPPPSGSDEIELPEPERTVGERLELDQRASARRRKRTPAPARAGNGKPAGDEGDVVLAGGGASDDGDAAAGDGDAPRRRRRRGGRGRGRAGASEAEGVASTEAAGALTGEVADVEPDDDAPEAVESEGVGEGGPKRRRRGRRGGRGRRRPAAVGAGGDEPAPQAARAAGPPEEPAQPPPPPAPERPAAPVPAARGRQKGFLDRLFGR